MSKKAIARILAASAPVDVIANPPAFKRHALPFQNRVYTLLVWGERKLDDARHAAFEYLTQGKPLPHFVRVVPE